jgi:hypothetical protein
MSLTSLLTTPVPPYSFLVDSSRVAYAALARRRDALGRAEAVAIDPDWCRLGPVGLLHIERQLLAAALDALLARVGKLPSRASLVIPGDWVRALPVEAEGLPRNQEEAEDVVRWRLKKLLPCRPEEVRLDFARIADSGRVLVMLALDRPLSVIEDTFAEKGVSLGRIEPLALALGALVPPVDGLRMLVVLEEKGFGLVLADSVRPLMARFKPLAGGGSQASAFLMRELSRTLAYAKEHGDKQQGPVSVFVASQEGELLDSLLEWASGAPDVKLVRLGLEDGPWSPTEGLSPLHLAALLATAAHGEG